MMINRENCNLTTPHNIKSVIIALAEIYEELFDISIIRVVKARNASVYAVNSKDGKFSTEITFGGREEDCTEKLNQMVEYLCNHPQIKSLIDSTPSLANQPSAYRIINLAKEIKHNAYMKSVINSEEEKGITYEGVVSAIDRFAHPKRKDVEDFNLANKEYRAFYISNRLIRDCEENPNHIRDLDDLIYQLNIDYFDKIPDMRKFEENYPWIGAPVDENPDISTDYLRTRLFTIFCLHPDLIYQNISIMETTDNAIQLQCIHRPTRQKIVEDLHQKECRKSDTEAFKHRLFKLLTKEKNYLQFGDEIPELSIYAERDIYNQLKPINLMRFISSSSIVDIMQYINLDSDVTMFIALFLNVAMLNGVTMDYPLFDNQVRYLQSLAPEERCYHLQELFDNNYDLAVKDPKYFLQCMKSTLEASKLADKINEDMKDLFKDDSEDNPENK